MSDSARIFHGFSAWRNRGPRNSIPHSPTTFVHSSPNPFHPPPGTLRNPPPSLPLSPAPPNPDHDLAGAIALLAQTLQQLDQTSSPALHERNNVWDPDQYDGSDPMKLWTFFMQLELAFKAHPRTFNSDEKKVTFVISYLKGTPLQWFEPYLLEGDSDNPPIFLSDYEEFQQELQVNFRPYDATGEAEHQLKDLRMLDSQQIAEYISHFNWLATQIWWSISALHYQFYKGLPACLQDHISEVGKPSSLHELRSLAQSLDHWFWERKAEQLWDSTSSTPSSSDSDSESNSDSSGPDPDSDSEISSSDSSPDPSEYECSESVPSEPTSRLATPSPPTPETPVELMD